MIHTIECSPLFDAKKALQQDFRNLLVLGHRCGRELLSENVYAMEWMAELG